MKKTIFLLVAVAFLASCAKQSTVDEPVDKWNGYAKYLKCGEKTKALRDKDKNVVGIVRSGIDQDAHFYVTYDTRESGKKLVKSNVYAGNKKFMPVSKHCDPKEDHFPKQRQHDDDDECYFTHRVPLCDLPPADEPGFVYAAHCRFKHHDNDCDHDAWADGNKHFHDKGCGDYDEDYEEPENNFTILYGTAYSDDSLKLYMLDITNGTTEMILQEYVGNSAGSYDAAAYDAESGIFLFANYNTGELYVNNLKDDDPSFSCGLLLGTAASATFHSGDYYYINEDLNTINKVVFNTDWTISSETILDTIPSSISINDIAMNLEGTQIHMLGEVNGGGKELITWDVATETFYSTAITITTGAQIAYGSDGVLYAIAPITEGGSYSLSYTVDPSSGTLTPVEDDVIIIDDPFSDLSSGPIM
jgi:hypothetical protein